MPEHVIERRSSGPVKVERREDGTARIRGVAPVYYRAGDEGTEFHLWGPYVERVRAGAGASATEAGADVLSLQNHDSNRVLGRTTAGTLTLEDTDLGLEFEVDPPDTASARELITSLERGDVTGSSFMFRPTRVTWEDEFDDGGEVVRSIRWLEEVQIFEVGPQTFPAYTSSTAELAGRDREHVEIERERFMSERAAPHSRGNIETYRRRLSMLTLDDAYRLT